MIVRCLSGGCRTKPRSGQRAQLRIQRRRSCHDQRADNATSSATTRMSGSIRCPGAARRLVLPEYGIGLLSSRTRSPPASTRSWPILPISVTQGLVVGYDFLTDGATAMADALDPQQTFVTWLISDARSADTLRNHWLATRKEISAINAHFTHDQAFPPHGGSGAVTAGNVVTSTVLSGTLSYSVGCHSGLNVPG